MNLFESIYYDLLLEGKSPEEILGILKYKFKNVPEQIIDTVFNIDPTKKKSYTTWVLNHYDQEKHVIDNAIRNGSLKKLFGYLQSHQDAQLSKYQTLEEALYLVSNIDLLQKDSDDPKANDFDIVFKSPEWVIAVPNTYEASHKLGENTDWCTAGYKYNDGRGYYNNYLNRYGGKYFINFDLRSGEHINGIDYPFKRYQYHFESNQFMDADDNPVSFDETNMPEDVVNYYEENGYSFNKMNEEERIEEYETARYDDGVRLTDNLWILQEYDHDNHELAQGNNASYMLYNVLGTLQKDLGNDTAALSAFNKSIEIEPTEPPYYNRARLYMAKEEYDKAISDYSMAIKYSATNPDAYKERAAAKFAKVASQNITGEEFKKIILSAYEDTDIALKQYRESNNAEGYQQVLKFIETMNKIMKGEKPE